MSDVLAQRDLTRRLEQTQVIERARTNYGPTKPTSPTTNVPFFDTTAGFWVYWDGARWLTAELFQCDMTPYARSAQPFAGAGPTTVLLAPQRADYATYYARAKAYLDVLATNNATNYWILTLTLGATLVWTVNTSGDAAGAGLNKEDSTAAACTAQGIAVANLQKGGAGAAPGNIVLNVTYWYRLIIP